VEILEQRVGHAERTHGVYLKLFEDLRIIHLVEGLPLEDPGVVNEQLKGLPLKALGEGSDVVRVGQINARLDPEVQRAQLRGGGSADGDDLLSPLKNLFTILQSDPSIRAGY
jgi:hypothetical protein